MGRKGARQLSASEAPTAGALALSIEVTTVAITRRRYDLYLVPQPEPEHEAESESDYYEEPESDSAAILCPVCDLYSMAYGVGCSICGTTDSR
jgi:hypothetical protein